MLPVDTQEIDRYSRQHDSQANAAHHWLRPQAEDQQEGPEQQIYDGKQQIDLWDRSTVSYVALRGFRMRAPSLFFILLLEGNG